jgi:hypothetical protein
LRRARHRGRAARVRVLPPLVGHEADQHDRHERRHDRPQGRPGALVVGQRGRRSRRDDRSLDGGGLVEAPDRLFRVLAEESRIGANEPADVDRRTDRLPVLVFDGVEVDRTDVDLFGDVREREPARFTRASELVSERWHWSNLRGCTRFSRCMVQR